MGNIVDTVKRFSSNDTTPIPAQRCSDLSIRTSRLDRCTCTGNGIPVTGETSSVSKGGNINGCKDFCEGVPNEGMHMTPDNTSAEGCIGDINVLTLDESTETPRSLMLDVSNDSLCKVSAEGNTNLGDDVENSPATAAHRGKEFILNRVFPAAGLFDHNVCEELVDDVLDSAYKSSTEVSLDEQRHEQRTQHKSLNYDVVPIEVKTASASLQVSNPKSPLKRRAKRQRNKKASSQTLVPKENTRTLVPSDLICLEIEKQPTSQLLEQSSGDVMQGAPRSRMSKTPLYVHQSPLTRSKLKAPSITTPESVKMKRSRSGRVIVPRLDPGSQNIIYDQDGYICGITNMETQLPQGISSEPPPKRRKSQRLSPDDTRLLKF